MHQRLRRFGPWALVGLASLLFMGCTQILNLIEGASGSPNNPGTPPAAADSIRVVISELSANMVRSTKFSPAQANVVAKSAQDYVTAANVSETDFAEAIPVAVAGAEAGLTNANFTEQEQIDAVGVITTSFMNSLKGRFEVTSRSSRALAANAQVVSTLLARISQAAVKNLAKTGITSANLGQTAGAIVGNMITGLNGGGVNKALVSEALAQITQSAVATLKESGLTTTEALGAAVQAVTKGAVSAVATISVEGVSSSDFPALTSQITQGASESLGKIASSAEDVAKLVKSVATGSSEGIVAVAKASSTVTAAQLSSMVQSATSGTTTGVMKSDFVNASQDAAGLIGNITEATSASLASTANTVAVLSQSEIQKAVTIGASSAAKSAVPNGGLDAAALASAIVLKDSAGAAVAVDPDNIAAGVSLGSNTAPAIVMADVLTVAVGSQVYLDASATSDDSDKVSSGLTFAWAVATKPQGAPTVVLSGDTTAKASFLPTVVGTYLFSLKVTDSRGAESEQFVTVFALANAGSATYGSKTAETRLADAKLMGKAGDVDLARDELLVILGHYPESTLTVEVNYWLAKAYQNLGDSKSAFFQFEKTIAMADATTPFGARARVDYAGSRIWDNRGAFDPKPLLDEVVAAQPNAPIATEAKAKLASLTRNNGQKPDGSFDPAAVSACIAEDQAALAVTGAASLGNEARFDVQADLAWSYVDGKDYDQASVEFLKLSALAQNNGPDSLTSVNNMRFNAVETYWWFAKNFANDKFLPASREALIALSNDPAQDADLRLKAVRNVMEYLIWNKPAVDNTAKAANLKEAAELPASVLAATSSVNDSKTKAQRTWVYTRIGNANDDWKNNVKNEADRPALVDAAMAAYKKAQDLGWGHFWGYRPAGEAMVNLAGNYLWNKGELNNRHDLALALVGQVIAEYPAEGGQWAKAYAQYRQGEIYADLGNQQRDQNGSLAVYVTTYNKAVVAFSRVSKSLFPTVDPNEWFFRDSVKQIGECYAKMRQYTAAESYFNLILNDTSYKPEDKVWIQLSLANALAEAFMQLVQDSAGPGNVDSSNQLWTTKVGPAYDAVGTYKAGDGTTLINRGEPWSHALLQKGRYLRDAANRWRWDHGLKSEVWTPLYQKAADAYRLVIPATFNDLPSDGWEFIEATQNLADCGFKLGVFADGRAALNDLLALMDAETVPNGGKWGILKELVNSYRDEANSLGDGLDDSGRIPLITSRVSLQLQAYDEALEMYGKWQAETAPSGEATKSTAWVMTDAGWSLLDAANTLGWDKQAAGPGQRGYTTADWTKIAAMETQILDLLTKVKGTALETANGGASIGRLNRILGHWFQDSGNRLADDTEWSVRKAKYTKAWDYFQACIDNGASEPDDVAASQRCQVGILSEYARQDYDPKAASDNNLAARKQAFEDATDLAMLVVSNTGANRSEAAWASITMAQLYRDLHSSHALRRDQLGGVGIAGMDGPTAWQTSVRFWVEAIADKTGLFVDLNDGGPIQEAQRLVDDAKNGGSLNVTVQ